MNEKEKRLSPSAKAFLALMMKVKGKTALEIMREFIYEMEQRRLKSEPKEVEKK